MVKKRVCQFDDDLAINQSDYRSLLVLAKNGKEFFIVVIDTERKFIDIDCVAKTNNAFATYRDAKIILSWMKKHEHYMLKPGMKVARFNDITNLVKKGYFVIIESEAC